MNNVIKFITNKVKSFVVDRCSEKNLASKEFDRKYKLNKYVVLGMLASFAIILILSFFKSGGVEVTYENASEVEVKRFNSDDEELNLKANIKIGDAEGDLDFTTLYPKEKPTDVDVVDRLLEIINDDLIKNENESLDCVTSNLYLETKNAYGAQINYESLHGYINIKTGEVVRKPKGNGDTKDTLKVIVSYGDVKKVKELKITIKEDERTPDEIRVEKSIRALKELIKDKMIFDDGKLIKDVEGVPVSFSKVMKRDRKDYLFPFKIFFLILLLILGLYLYESLMRIINADKKRTEELEREFPNFIEEYMLLNKAGYTLPVAINYIASKSDKGILKGELKRISDEISRDVILYDSLNSFAIRSGSEMIKKFILGLSSNLKRGSSHMNLFLAKELELSNIERRNEYEKRASENSTKAIMPLLLVLIATMLMVVYPATLAIKM